MLTKAELNALIQLLQRFVPLMSQLEALKVQELIAKMQARIVPPAERTQGPMEAEA